MFNIIAITDRKCCDDFKKRLSELTQNKIPFILREKDLSKEEYYKLSRYAKNITDNFMIHTHIDIARKLGHKKIHLTMKDFLDNDVSDFETVGVSVHSIEEAIECEKKGSSYITYSHIFPTDCKKGLKPKGIDKLKEVCQKVKIPVYALGGINADNVKLVARCGVEGICVMSLLMKCKCVEEEIEKFTQCS